jgi:hypothetical protein
MTQEVVLSWLHLTACLVNWIHFVGMLTTPQVASQLQERRLPYKHGTPFFEPEPLESCLITPIRRKKNCTCLERQTFLVERKREQVENKI